MPTRPHREGYRPLRRVDPARQIAYEVLRDVSTKDAYANLLLPSLLRDARKELPHFDSRDTAFTSELVYGTLRQQGRLDWIISRHLTRPLSDIDITVINLLRLGAHQIMNMRVPDHAAVAATVDLARVVSTDGPARMVNAVLRSILREGVEEIERAINAIEDDDTRLSILYSHPTWMVKSFREALAVHGYPLSELEDLLTCDNEPPIVTLVARPGLIESPDLADEVVNVLNTRVAPGEVSKYAVLMEHGDPAALPSVRSGMAGVQDEGSQLAAIVAACAPITGKDAQWLDLCAGPGGKASLIASVGAKRGAYLVANEIHSHRARLVERSLRCLNNAEVVCGDGRTFGGAQARWTLGSFDRVVVDAPCTGLGSLRRRPESRWRRMPADINDCVALQNQLLDRACELVRPGGVVTFITCSPLPGETTGQVQRLLEEGKVELLDTVAIAQEQTSQMLNIPPEAGYISSSNSHEYFPGRTLQLWQHRHETDLMFIAALRKVKDK